MFISVEGNDASGKTTLIKKIAEHLTERGFKVKIVPEFSNEFLTGRYIKKILNENKFIEINCEPPIPLTETLLVLTDLCYLNEKEVSPCFYKYDIIIKERHVDSIFACQIPRILHFHRDLNFYVVFNWLYELCKLLRWPDLTFLLTIPENVMIKRILQRGEEINEDELNILRKRAEIYVFLAKKFSDRIIVYNNATNIEKAVRDICDIILKRICKV